MQTDRWHPGRCSSLSVSERSLWWPCQEALKANAWTLLFAHRAKLIEIPFLPHRRLGVSPQCNAATYFTLCCCGVMKPDSKNSGWQHKSKSSTQSLLPYPPPLTVFLLEVKWGKKTLDLSVIFSLNPLYNTSLDQFGLTVKFYYGTLAPGVGGGLLPYLGWHPVETLTNYTSF